jgi:hypothetical protein
VRRKKTIVAIPESITFQKYIMSSDSDEEDRVNEDDSNESRSDDESNKFRHRNDPEACPTQADYDRFKKQWNDERHKLKVIREKLENQKKKRAATKKVLCIRKLPEKMRLPLAKEAMLLHTLREKMFCSVKIVDASILSDGVIVSRVMRQVGVKTDEDKKNYRRHFELAIAKKIGEFRSNSIRKLRKTFMGERNDLTGEFIKYLVCVL